eukprot:CAMPEP_0119137128 /NCGR_PEP_ID=MMETSP1310-20130426/22968_1 /TAXON_ID=464262 /ORGANISM="Genus nov. species nov., Strain RCC2339" /LENGTH=369 /DNA_ID=CAMNT_0007128187 /DNA_START=81 /DNA_END=1190 /DNA_ORIENTATION=+
MVASMGMVVVAISLLTGASGIPQGMTTFFSSAECPTGWSELPYAQGRLIVSTTDGTAQNITVGTPLSNLEDREHSHSIATTINLETKSISAIGCCNPTGACHGDYDVTGLTTTEASSIPFVQFTLCEYTAPTDNQAVPFGTIAYFSPDSISQCSDLDDWVALTTVTGRVMIPGYSSGLVLSADLPLANGEDRAHDHTFTTVFKTEDNSYAGVTGCCNDKLAARKDYTVAATTSAATTNVPYIQLLTCQYQFQDFSSDLPDDALIFTEINCPPNYTISQLASGRFPVAKPVNGTNQGIFGGSSLPDGDPSANYHDHPFNSWFDTSSCEVGLASGCCGDGYVKDEQYISTGITDSSNALFPFAALPLCEKS